MWKVLTDTAKSIAVIICPDYQAVQEKWAGIRNSNDKKGIMRYKLSRVASSEISTGQAETRRQNDEMTTGSVGGGVCPNVQKYADNYQLACRELHSMATDGSCARRWRQFLAMSLAFVMTTERPFLDV